MVGTKNLNNKKITNLLLSFGICIVFAIIGGLLVGNALEDWFAYINQPWFSIPLWGWYIVGGLYYIMVIVLLTRLMNRIAKPIASEVFWLILGMLSGNELWNYLFFGLESTFLGFVSLFPFTILVIVLLYKLYKIDRPSAWILLPYVIWLGYDLIWTYSLWRLNE